MAAPSRPRQEDCITVLPRELRQCIVERLPWGRDVANFRLTGKLWRATVPLVDFTPLLMLPFDPESPDGAVVTFYRPTDGETITKNLPALHGKVVCGSSHGWLALEDVSATVTLLNPFTGATVDLPRADKYVGKEKSMGHALMDADGSGRYLIRLDKVRDVFFRDIVLSSPPDSGDCCVAMALVPCSRVVAFCRVGVDPAWRTVLIEEPRPRRGPCWVPINSVVHCRGTRFVAVGLDRQVFVCDDVAAIATPVVTLVRSLLLPRICCRGYLQLNGELHFVGSFRRGYAPRTQVYKCDIFAMNPSWSRVQDVGDMTLFVSKNFTTGFSGPSVLGLTKNSVYFSEPVNGHQDPDQADHELEISDIDNGTSELLSYHKKIQSSWMAPCWIQPKPNPWTQGAHGNA